MKVYKEFDAVQFDGTKDCLLEMFTKVEVRTCTSYHPTLNLMYIVDGYKIYPKVGDWVMRDAFGTITTTSEENFKKCKFVTNAPSHRPRRSEETHNFVELCSLNRDRIYRLLELGVLTDGKDNVRDHNVGKSNYATHTIQSWSLWQDWNLNPWDADIIKRIERTKEGEEPTERYEKIIHICNERLRQIRLGEYKIDSEPNMSGENIKKGLEKINVDLLGNEVNPLNVETNKVVEEAQDTYTSIGKAVEKIFEKLEQNESEG